MKHSLNKSFIYFCVLLSFAFFSKALLADESDFRNYAKTYFENKQITGLSLPAFKSLLEDSEKNPYAKFSNPQMGELISEIIKTWKTPSCNESVNGAAPPIVLFGEKHDCPNCSLEFERRLVDVYAGDAILAVEAFSEDRMIKFEDLKLNSRVPPVADFNNRKATIFSVQKRRLSPFVLLSLQYSFVQNLLSGNPKIEDLSLEDFLKTQTNESYYDELFSKGSITIMHLLFLKSPEHDRAQLLEALRRSQLEKRDWAFMRDWSREFRDDPNSIIGLKSAYASKIKKYFLAYFSLESYSHFLKELIKAYVQSYREEMLQELQVDKKLAGKFFDSLLEHTDGILPFDFVNAGIVPLRSLNFASRIMNIYCTQAVPAKLPLYVQFGALHALPVRDFLKAANPRIPVRIENDAVKFYNFNYDETLLRMNENTQLK